MSQELLIFPDDALLTLIYHFDLLLILFGDVLSLLDFLFPSSVLKIPNLLLKSELVTDQDVIKLLVLKCEFPFCTFS